MFKIWGSTKLLYCCCRQTYFQCKEINNDFLCFTVRKYTKCTKDMYVYDFYFYFVI